LSCDSERKFHRALDHLQKLVIQRFFELNRLNLAGTGVYQYLNQYIHSRNNAGYRMRTHIAKSLNTRCKAIQNAVKTYNAAAMDLNPPRPTLDWEKASHYNFLEDFELLRDTHNDICAKPWVEPLIQVAMKQAQRIQRAREEIYNCNIEVRRLHTHLLDESSSLHKIAIKLKCEAHPIAGALEDFVTRRHRTNIHLLACIEDIHHLEGFTGEKTPGTRIGQPDELVSELMEGLSILKGRHAADDEGSDQDLDDDEAAMGEYGGLVEFVSDMPLSS
jgi:hypothetical protein